MPYNNQEFLSNILKQTDSYKITHWKAYIDGTEKVVSYLEARSDSDFSDRTVFFGLQYIIQRYLSGQVITEYDMPKMEAFCRHHFLGRDDVFNKEGWEYIIKEHGGKLPIKIRAVPEGSVVKTKNVLMTVENTDPKCFWLTNYIESILLHVWYPTTVASMSYAIKQIILQHMMETVDDNLISSILPSRLHDFGYRGATCHEAASIGGCAHLLSFAGTDNISAIDISHQYYANENYSKTIEKEAINQYAHDAINDRYMYNILFKIWDEFYKESMSGFSIPATEHSMMTIKGSEGEKEACESFLNAYPEGIIACVSDSYDLYNLCEQVWGDELKEKILSRKETKSNIPGTLVIRPDSGDPKEVLPKVFDILEKAYGSHTNSKGYKVLDNHIRVIQGDGVNHKTIDQILTELKNSGWSAENIAFGCGGALLQKMNRDTFAFAIKACLSVIDGEEHEVYKLPKTGNGDKKSKSGYLSLKKDENGNYKTEKIEPFTKDPDDQLVTVFENGQLIKDWTFGEIKQKCSFIKEE